MNDAVLVVDDEWSIRNLFEEILGDAGYRVLASENAEGALATLQENDINIIFLDLKLFGMNGIELCRRIRSHKPLAIIYAMTGWSGLFEIEECREAGFDDFFRKPIIAETIKKATDEAFEKIERWTTRRR